MNFKKKHIPAELKYSSPIVSNKRIVNHHCYLRYVWIMDIPERRMHEHCFLCIIRNITAKQLYRFIRLAQKMITNLIQVPETYK